MGWELVAELLLVEWGQYKASFCETFFDMENNAIPVDFHERVTTRVSSPWGGRSVTCPPLYSFFLFC